MTIFHLAHAAGETTTEVSGSKTGLIFFAASLVALIILAGAFRLLSRDIGSSAKRDDS